MARYKVHSAFDPPVCEPFFDDASSLTHQSFAAEADIRTIMARYGSTGSFIDSTVDCSTRTPSYGDFSTLPDFHAAQNIVAQSVEHFESLNVNLRERFGYDPANLLEFLNDPANRQEAISLGIVSDDNLPQAAPQQASAEANS